MTVNLLILLAQHIVKRSILRHIDVQGLSRVILNSLCFTASCKADPVMANGGYLVYV